MKRFDKNEVIKHKDKMYQCIVCDDEVAVFGKIKEEDGKATIDASDPIILNQQNVYDGFEYAKVDSKPAEEQPAPKKGRK